MEKIKILWIDDEIDLLKIHFRFLESKGYEVEKVSNTVDAKEILENQDFDIIFLDENMPGQTGLEFLPEIKKIKPFTPIVMITKVEDEEIMEEAIGEKINDYLIKPVNPKQILLVIKKHVQKKKIVSQQTIAKYQGNFMEVATKIITASDCNDWIEIYKNLTRWELDLEEVNEDSLKQILYQQKDEANNEFGKFVKKNYLDWINSEERRPFFIKDVFKKKIFPALSEGKVVLIVIDNLRYDQLKILEYLIKDNYRTKSEELIFSILPTATQYARNSLFAGVFPYFIKKQYPELWRDEEQEGNKNDFEEDLLKIQISRFSRKMTLSFHKIFNEHHAKKVINNLNTILENDLTVIVFNFVDMLSHAKTSVQMVKELAKDEAAYRALTQVWFEHSYLNTLFKKLKDFEHKIFITTDHGSILVKNPVKVVGDKQTSTNLRYKQSKSLTYPGKRVFEITNPPDAGLPAGNIKKTFIFALNRDFFVYPNNYNYFVNYYKNTFQHGGISLEEMLIPLVEVERK